MNVAEPAGVSALISRVKMMTTRPLLSRSVGTPKVFVSRGLMTLSKVAATVAYSLFVNPPVGFCVSSRMIADAETAATRMLRSVRPLLHPLAMLTFMDTRSPTDGGATTLDARRERVRYHTWADGTSGDSAVCSAAR